MISVLGRMKHWLVGSSTELGNTLSLQRDPSPDRNGGVEGQKTWYDYAGKTGATNEGTQIEHCSSPSLAERHKPLHAHRTKHPRSVTNEASTYSVTSDGQTLLRTNTYVYAATALICCE